MSAELRTKTISTGYTPREHQHGLHLALKRFNVIVCHRRFGKTILGINHAIHRLLTCDKPMPRVFYIAPSYGQAKRICWDYLKQFTSMIDGVEYNEAELRADFPHNKGRIQLLSAENPAALKGVYADFVVLDEYGDMSPIVWSEAVRPTLADRGGSALFIGTVKGQNHFWELYEQVRDGDDPEWFAALYKASETKIIPQSELDSMRKTMSEEAYASELECDPLGGLIGAYFAKEIMRATAEKRIGIYPHDPMTGVDTYWDLGLNDAMSVWFVQSQRDQHKFIDYYEVSGLSIPEVWAEIHKNKYLFNRIVLPHDAAVRDLSTGRSRVQNFQELGARNITMVPRIGKKMESINAARVAFSKCWFDAEKCKQGIKALSNYKKKWDDKRQTFSETPDHNWASNAADAFQQFAMSSRPDTKESDTSQFQNRRGEMVADTDYNPFSRGE